jgi:LAO/AO transport system kinase
VSDVPERPGAPELPGVPELIERARQGEQRAVARLISLVENDSPQRAEIAAVLTPLAGRAQIVGLTGAPGVGKSTTTTAIIAAYRARGVRVGVLAMDPSSPFSGGALLGDRIRMGAHATDPGVFIRSMASRGQLGGVAAAAPQAIRVLDVAGCDLILVETVGVGQAELDIATLADTVLVLVAPGMGDGVQAAKAGVLEIADVLVVNKADRPGAQQVARDLRAVQKMKDAQDWTVPVLSIVAARSVGIDEVCAAMLAHREWISTSGDLARRRQARAGAEIEAIALGQLRTRLVAGSALRAGAEQVAVGVIDPYQAAAAVIDRQFGPAFDRVGKVSG